MAPPQRRRSPLGLASLRALRGRGVLLALAVAARAAWSRPLTLPLPSSCCWLLRALTEGSPAARGPWDWSTACRHHIEQHGGPGCRTHVRLQATRDQDEYWSYSTREIQQAMLFMGIRGSLGSFERSELIQLLSRFPPKQVRRALAKVVRKRQGPREHGEAVRSGGFWDFETGQLRSVLNIIGIQGTREWSKGEVIQELHSRGISPQDLEEVIARPSQSRIGSRSRGYREPGRRRRQGEHDDEVLRDLEWIRHLVGNWDDDDEEDEDFYDDFEFAEPVMDSRFSGNFEEEDDDEGWEAGEWFRHRESPFEPRSSASWGRQRAGRQEVPPAWGARGGAADVSCSPEEAMALALRDDWNSERLSREQACLVLGLPFWPAPTEDEVRVARKALVLKWHPDRHPEEARALEALRLVVAASKVLSPR